MKNHWSKLLIFSFSLLIFVGCKNRYFVKGLRDTYLRFRLTPDIGGYKVYKNRVINTGTPQPWNVSKNYNRVTIADSSAVYLKKNKTAAFLIIKNDSICYEKYYDGFSDTSHTNSWSMAKSVVSLLIGVAIKEGKIKSVDEKVSDFIPSYNKGFDTLLAIKDLLTMSSGIDFGENYANPFGYPAKALYGNNLLWLTLKHHCVIKPGTKFFYQSGNTVLLGEIVRKATGETMSEYASEKLWKPLGAERQAFWSLDHKNGIEKGFCCFYSNARDFARFGKLMLDSGKWNGEQIIPKQYFIESSKGQKVNYYGYQWWLDIFGGHKVVYASGFSGQYIMAIPDENMIVVRLGKIFQEEDVTKYGGMALGMYGK